MMFETTCNFAPHISMSTCSCYRRGYISTTESVLLVVESRHGFCRHDALGSPINKRISRTTRRNDFLSDSHQLRTSESGECFRLHIKRGHSIRQFADHVELYPNTEKHRG